MAKTGFPLFLAILFPLFWSKFVLAGCFTNDTLSRASTEPASTAFSHFTLIPTPTLRPNPLSKLVALSPGSSATVQPTQPSKKGLKSSVSCPADAKMINPAHAQLLSATTLSNLRSTPSTSSFKSACHPMLTSTPL